MSRDKLEAIERLQTLDAEIDEASKSAAHVPARRAELEAEVARVRAAADQQRGLLADNERARRSTQQLLEDEKDKIKKWEARLPQLKHPREFAALQREVENAKKANLQAEEDLKRLESEGAELKGILRTKEADLAAKEQSVAVELAELARQEAAFQASSAQYGGQRENLKAAVDPALLKAYEAIRRRVKGKAVVSAQGGSCTGCNRRLPPQLAIKLHGGFIEPCPSCYRLVYLPPPPPGA